MIDALIVLGFTWAFAAGFAWLLWTDGFRGIDRDVPIFVGGSMAVIGLAAAIFVLAVS